MNFDELKIKPSILDGIKKAQYTEMTDIQTQVIPVALENRDIIGQAPTGTGKTCAFVVPTLERFNPDDHFVQTLVMCPTRELAAQITTEYKKIGQFIKGLKILSIYGGQKISQQFRLLKEQPQIIIGTPGRILDHIERKTINLTKVKTVVLDEADEMLDMGFIRDIDKILSKTSGIHQTILLSATMDKTIMEISRKYQKDPHFVKATIDEKDIPSITQHYIKTPEFKKVEVITKLIKDKNFFLVLIFTNTRRKAKWLVYQLRNLHLTADALHSDLKQSARDRVMRDFREGKLQILVATDIAARGIDVKGVDAVINYDVPKDMKYYVHRIGRTARAQAIGNAYTLIASDVHGNLRTIERETKDRLLEHKMEGIDFNERPPVEQNDRFQGHDRSRRFGKRDDKFNRGDKPRFEHRDNREPREFNNRKPDRPTGSTTRFFVTVGSKDNVDNHSLKNILSKDMNIPQADIADVWVRDTYSFIEVKNNQADVIRNLREINGRNVKVQVANPKKPRSDRGDGFRSRDNYRSNRFGEHNKNRTSRNSWTKH